MPKVNVLIVLNVPPQNNVYYIIETQLLMLICSSPCKLQLVKGALCSFGEEIKPEEKRS